MKKSKIVGTYRSPREMVSPIDLLSRNAANPFVVSMKPPTEESVAFVHFYATAWNGEWAREDRGLGHGSNFRRWSFSGYAKVATGGTVTKLTWSRWIKTRGNFIESKEGLVLEIIG
jgi:hypothetical protein